MKLSFSSNAFSNYDIFFAINNISKTGFDAIELVLDQPHAFLPLKKKFSCTLPIRNFRGSGVEVQTFTRMAKINCYILG